MGASKLLQKKSMQTKNAAVAIVSIFVKKLCVLCIFGFFVYS